MPYTQVVRKMGLEKMPTRLKSMLPEIDLNNERHRDRSVSQGHHHYHKLQLHRHWHAGGCRWWLTCPCVVGVWCAQLHVDDAHVRRGPWQHWRGRALAAL